MTGLGWFMLITGLVAALTAWLLTSPLRLIVDTETRFYAIQWRGLMTVKLLSQGHLQWWVIGWTTVTDVQALGRMFRRTDQKKKPQRPARRRRLPFRRILAIGQMVGRTFRLRTCYIDLDTDNYILNAQLYPIFGLLSGPQRRLHINFRGEQTIRLVIENRLYRILLAFIRIYSS